MQTSEFRYDYKQNEFVNYLNNDLCVRRTEFYWSRMKKITILIWNQRRKQNPAIKALPFFFVFNHNDILSF